ncbi:3940_t:CDS:1, partial [Acaulospora colombiana]
DLAILSATGIVEGADVIVVLVGREAADSWSVLIDNFNHSC